MAHTKERATLLTAAATLVGYASIHLYNMQLIEGTGLLIAAGVLAFMYEKLNIRDVEVSSKEIEEEVLELTELIRDYMDDSKDYDVEEAIRDLLARKQVKREQ